LEQNPKFTHIALYHPLPDEPDLLRLMDRLPGRTWYFPRISENTMTFHAVSSLNEDLTPGVFGILEPKPSLPATDPKDIQAFFCPGLAFEKSTGLRLGRGKGYYDRYLAQSHAEARRIGVTFPERLVEDTFSEPHDIRMDLVIS
jgi:5-formyltetrahydrofolate cyclo-ligase